jgi:hypothetical protein
MKNRAVVLTVTAVLVLLAAAHLLWRPSAAPPSQEPLVALSSASFSGFQNTFDGDSNVPRLVLLLSPT